MSKRAFAALLCGGLALGAAAPVRGQHAHPPAAPAPQAAPALAGEGPIRRTMEELHQHGGVPPGWTFRVPPGDPREGREVFVKLECFACHRVAGESFPKRDAKPTEKGPDLTGMGGRHPAEYFFESVLHPNRVIASDPGFTGEDGLSLMPGYNHLLTLEDALHLTAYLKSLTGGGHPQGSGGAPMAAAAASPPAGQGPFTEIRIQGGKLAAGGQKVIRVKQGETARLRFLADKETALHLHGYNIERAAKPGAPAEMVFPARAAGRFPVTVHGEGSHGGGHGAEETLIYLEVHPR